MNLDHLIHYLYDHHDSNKQYYNELTIEQFHKLQQIQSNPTKFLINHQNQMNENERLFQLEQIEKIKETIFPTNEIEKYMFHILPSNSISIVDSILCSVLPNYYTYTSLQKKSVLVQQLFLIEHSLTQIFSQYHLFRFNYDINTILSKIYKLSNSINNMMDFKQNMNIQYLNDRDLYHYLSCYYSINILFIDHNQQTYQLMGTLLLNQPFLIIYNYNNSFVMPILASNNKSYNLIDLDYISHFYQESKLYEPVPIIITNEYIKQLKKSLLSQSKKMLLQTCQTYNISHLNEQMHQKHKKQIIEEILTKLSSFQDID